MIPLFKVFMSPDAAPMVAKTLESGYVGQGERVEEFEVALERFTGAPVLTTCSGTAALDLALHLCGVEPGDEVVTTPQTCTATNGVIVRRGAVPVFCDVDPLTGNIDPEDVRRNLTDRTRAIMAVDWGGRACDYAALRSFGPPVIEDAAHAVGTTIDGRHVARVGGDYVAFSFQAIKHLNTADGGGLATPDDQFERARLLRWYGLDRRSRASFRCEQNIDEVGYKYHMNDVAASIGIANIARLPDIIAAHRSNARRLCQELASVDGVVAPKWDPESSWWIYTILVSDVPDFMARMRERGIETSPVHARNDKHTAFRAASRSSASMRGVDEFSRRQVAIPVGWWLAPEDVTRIVEAVDVCSRAP